MRRPALVLLALSLLAGLPAEAQRRDDIAGKLVRVTSPNFADHVVTGTVTAYTTEGVRVTEQGSGTEYLFPLRSVQRLDIFRGAGAGATASRRLRSFGFIGLALGTLAGPVIAIVTDSDMATTTLATAAVGGLTGAVVGATTAAAHPTEQWSWTIHPWGYDAELRPETQPQPEAPPQPE